MFAFQGETPKQRAEKANDQELAEYLENRQHYQMIQREDQETAVWRSLCPKHLSVLKSFSFLPPASTGRVKCDETGPVELIDMAAVFLQWSDAHSS